tara:strand:- start:261 stop:695 length:435 start_codon:yes stop_codon:yes gene_type:complete
MANRDIQYVARRDASGTWRILNTWDETVASLEMGEDVPDTHEAVTLLTEGQYLAVLREATNEGLIQSAAVAENMSLNTRVMELEEDLEVAQRWIAENREDDTTSPSYSNLPDPENVSESYLLKRQIIDSLTNMVREENITGLVD